MVASRVFNSANSARSHVIIMLVKLSQLGEFGLIERISKHQRKRKGTVIGIGDDAAVLQASGKYLLITTDTLIENVHFRLKEISFFDLGYKALAVNISDIAAMGGWPTHALVTIGVPKTISVKSIDELYRGIHHLAKKHKIDVVGGDTVASPKEIVVSITLLGEVEKENLLLRSTAKVGDLICVTGVFGGPAASNFKLQTSNIKTKIKEAGKIAKSQTATSMIDSSDGLVRSVLEICKASKVGARIWEDKIPIAQGATLAQALYGGEEYALVFSVPREKVKKLKLKFTIVGEIVSSKAGVKLMGNRGKIKPLKAGGYDHFK